MKLTDNALKVLETRYFKKDIDGKIIENWEKLIYRVANDISNGNDKKKQKYIDLLDSNLFLPNSPTLMNAGNDLQQLSACFVLPLEDSMESIFTTIKNAALIHKSGGGTGFSFSKLREANSRVRTTNGVSSGPLSFLEVFNSATNAVKQGGTRRGANMAILSVDHPDIQEFITCKNDITVLTNFNISVGITQEFMQAVRQDNDYNLISPHTGEIYESINARDVFNLIVEMAHQNGEPGIIFLDKINEKNPIPQLGKMESTNPCGEQPLLPNEACNLGSINLAKLLNKKNKIDWKLLKKTIFDSVEFLEDVIDRSNFPLPEINETVKANRKIGLGIMGWADLLYLLKIPYNSDEAIELAEEIMEFVDYYAKVKSSEIAEEKGSFDNYKGSIYDTENLVRDKQKLDWKKLIKTIKNKGIRNSTVTTIAPTGTISMISNTSSGIEPQFSLVYVKNVMDGQKLLYVNPHFEDAIKKTDIYSKELMEKVAQSGSIQDFDEIPENIKKVFVTSHDVTPEWHIRMQAAFQKYCDNAVSKTINFKRSATKEDVHIAYELAYDLECKGITVYRDGSRDNQVMSVGNKKQHSKEVGKISPRNRPEITTGMTQKIETGCGHLYVTINTDEHGACEIFTQMGKVGGCASAQLEAIARLASLGLRSNVKVKSLVRQLKGIRCPSPMWSKGKKITSCADGMAYALETYLDNYSEEGIKSVKIHEPTERKEQVGGVVSVCPECGSAIEHAEGCLKCHSCGWSKC
ncbi:MAG: vitamin B12-dependent ribonucleotide reductase [Candidatus Cloacimonadota bacterium]|nr:vitamin B12-dependent ribonucleotide reductase [Candidatus Cloacimonadota bacterium]